MVRLQKKSGNAISTCCFLRRNHVVAILAVVGLTALVLFMPPQQMPPTAEPQSLLSRQTNNVSTDTVSNNNACQWRPEPLLGVCDGTKVTPKSQLYTTAADCEAACCQDPECITFQFRAKEKCQFGGDHRLGSEGDGISSWCEPRAPAPWQGQWIIPKGSAIRNEAACLDSSWSPQELSGQCFGLGTKRPETTPQACRDACCAMPDCALWQWRKDAGCYYNRRGFNCQAASPIDLEPFVGKRKVQPGRSYQPYAYSGDFADLAGMETKP